MFGRLLLLILGEFLIYSCAQVGTITGGDKDEIAPGIVFSSIQSGALNVQNNELIVLFDERVVLNKPLETAILMPKDAKLNIEHQNKKIVIRWDKPLKPNTTYSLSLNGTVKDFHEGNDSLYQWIFSTGSIIDSAKHSIKVVDAFTEKPVAKAIVAIYDAYEDSLPRYFGISDANGLVKINAIKPKAYWIRAFIDKNKNLTNDLTEIQGMYFDSIEVFNNEVDSSTIFLSKPISLNPKPSIKFISPGLLAIKTEHQANLKIQAFSSFQNLNLSNKHTLSNDSVIYEVPLNTDSIRVVCLNDTLAIELSKRDKEKALSIDYLEKNNGNSDTLNFYCSDVIESIDTSKIRVIYKTDTLNPTVNFVFNEFRLMNTQIKSGKYTVDFQKEAIIGITGNTNDKQKKTVSKNSSEELGSFIFHRESTNPIVVQLLKNGQVVKEQYGKNEEFIFNNLLPDNYQIRLIEDLNENGKWDALNIQEKKQAERVKMSTVGISARANWEIKKNLDDLFNP